MADNPYAGLRTLALSANAEQLGFSPTVDLPDVFGVVADLELQGTATLVCLRDGTTSLYYSSGGGAIGLGQHESIRQAALSFVGLVQEYLGTFSSGPDALPLPPGHCCFTALTYGGTRSLTASEADLNATDSEAGSLYRAFHAVIGAYRLWVDTQPNDAR